VRLVLPEGDTAALTTEAFALLNEKNRLAFKKTEEIKRSFAKKAEFSFNNSTVEGNKLYWTKTKRKEKENLVGLCRSQNCFYKLRPCGDESVKSKLPWANPVTDECWLAKIKGSGSLFKAA